MVQEGQYIYPVCAHYKPDCKNNYGYQHCSDKTSNIARFFNYKTADQTG